MGRVKLIFSANDGPMGAFCCAWSWCQYSHMGAITPDDRLVWEARPFHGVVETNRAEFHARYKRWAEYAYPCKNPDAFFAFLESQKGKGYDWGLIGLGIGQNWDNPSWWYCSELIAGAFEAAGDPLFRPEFRFRILPRHIYMLAPGRG